MIKIKTKEEIEIMSRGGKVLSEMLDRLSKSVRPGITTKEIDKLSGELVLFYAEKERDAKIKPAFLGYGGYPANICLSINDEVVHGLPSDRKLNEGEIIGLDMGIKYHDFFLDSAITVPVLGDLSYKNWSGKNHVLHKLLEVTKEALNAGIKQARVGNRIGDIGHAVQAVIERNKFGVIRELVGHGIGRELHEEPQVPNFGRTGDGVELKEGMVIAIEPMVAVGDWQVKIAKDGFTYKTKDGSMSAHFEHTVAITKDGPIVLTSNKFC
ncbi:MAG TPA: type I methionyl aminopeptidase [Candidatus Paceibacterota bacterium]